MLFNGEADLQRALVAALSDVPQTVPPLTAMLQAFRSMVPLLERTRGFAEQRHGIIAATPALRERELAKEAALSAIVADALRGRGLADWRATLLAQVGTAALGHAIHTWVADLSGDLDALIVRALTEVRDFSDLEITSEPSGPDEET